jgi:uncharacterized beta-barrel protein YwiB (DUF1934 family)
LEKEVFIEINSLHIADGEEMKLDTKAGGKLYERNGKKFVSFEEVTEDGETVRNLLKFDSSFLEITKKGALTSVMHFEKGKEYITDYNTPFGMLTVRTYTKQFLYTEDKKEIQILTKYDMEINNSHNEKCDVKIRIMLPL